MVCWGVVLFVVVVRDMVYSVEPSSALGSMGPRKSR